MSYWSASCGGLGTAAPAGLVRDSTSMFVATVSTGAATT